MYTFVLYFIMYSEFVINIDVLKLSDVSDYFKHFVIRLDKKSRFYMTDVIVDVPSTISTSDLEAFLEVVSEKKILLMPLLEILDPYTIFVLADYFGVIQIFREIHFYHTRNLGCAPRFLRLMIEMWGKDHPETVSYYYTFMVSFSIPKPRLPIDNILETSLRRMKQLARNCSKSAMYFQSLQIENCFICQKEIKISSRIRQHAILGDTNESHIRMVCCATLLCSVQCVREILGTRCSSPICKRCRTFLRGGQLSSTVDNQYMKRLKIRNLNGVSMSTAIPPLNIPQIMGYI